MCVFVHVCAYVCVHVSACVRMRVRMCVCMCVCVCSVNLLAKILGVALTATGLESNRCRHKLAFDSCEVALRKLFKKKKVPSYWAEMLPCSICEDIAKVMLDAVAGALHLQQRHMLRMCMHA